ncbi:MAG TPA: YXWGXW repeat-containing protein [Candidatus Acidoferrales bacterium]
MRKSCFIAFLLAALMVFAAPSRSSAAQISVGISVHVGPPALPVLAVQPIAPGPGYIWTPGYWAYGPDGYYWVPGTWVLAPVGMLWTPGYWGWGGGAYVWHAGYWGPHVGFYGGVHYGFGYEGVGYAGGRWDHGVFAYNTAVSHVNVSVIHNTYVDRTVVVNDRNVTRVSFNGGEGGVHAEPNAQERMAMNEHHQAPIAAQMQHEHSAGMNRANFASENHGRPAVVATSRPNNSFHPPAHNEQPNHNEHVDHPANMNNGRQPENQNRGEAHHQNPPHDNQHPQHENNKDDRGHDNH